jgi:hypothetical protein
MYTVLLQYNTGLTKLILNVYELSKLKLVGFQDSPQLEIKENVLPEMKKMYMVFFK